MNSLRLSIAAAAFAAGVSFASAHGVWVAERWGDLAVIYGHGAEDSPYEPAKVTAVTAVDAAGKPVAIKVNADGERVWLSAAGEPAVILVDFDNGFWSKAADGTWSNKPKSQVPGATAAGHYLKNNISIIHLDGAMPVLPPQTLQVLPLANPTELKAGGVLRVRVLFEGKPLAGAKLHPDYVNDSEAAIGETDANGEADVVVRNNGLNVIGVSHEFPLVGDADADDVGYFATLRFLAGADHEG